MRDSKNTFLFFLTGFQSGCFCDAPPRSNFALMRSLRNLSDKELINQLKQLVEKEQSLTLGILLQLVEVKERGLYLEKAFSSLTEYCIHELGYGESLAWRRVRASSVIQEFPEVYDLMKQGRLSFSAVLQIARVIDASNKNSLLPRVVGKSKSQIDKILAEYHLPVAIPDMAKARIVKKQAPAQSSERTGGPGLGENSLHSEGKYDPTVKNSTPEIEVVLAKMFEIRFAADEELMELIKWLKSHLSHKYANGASFLEIFKYAMKYVREREDLSKRKTSKRKSDAKSDSRYIPKNVKQRVWNRDSGKCTFVGSNGKRCNSDYNLQFDHHPVPYARGGPSTVDNLRLLCAKHNKFTAELTYGENYIKKFCLKEPEVGYYTATRPLRTQHRKPGHIGFVFHHKHQYYDVRSQILSNTYDTVLQFRFRKSDLSILSRPESRSFST
jgi:hypothetical protein